MVVKENPPPIDRRRFARRQVNVAAAFSCRDTAYGISDWHFGSIQDAGTGGVGIRTNRAVALRRSQELEILCLPATDTSDTRQEVIRIQAKLIWQDYGRQRLGFQYL